MTSVAIAVAGLIALAVAMGIGRFAFTPLLPMMQEDAGVSVAVGGWLASANYLGYLIGALSAIWLRLPPRRAIRGGLIAIGVTTLGMGLFEHFVFWMVLRVLAGVASAWVLVFASAWCLEQLAHAHRPILKGGVFAGVGVGIVLVGVLCVVLMQSHTTSAQAWMILGIMAFAMSALTWRVFGMAPNAAPRAAAATDRFRWDGESVQLVLCYAVFGFAYIIPATFLPVMAKQVIPDPAVFGWSWPVFGAAAVASTLVAALWERRVSNRRLWAASHVVMALGIALPVVWSSIGGIMLSALLVGSTFMVIVMVAIKEARDVGGRHATGLIAAMTAGFAAGQVVGPISVSLWAHDGTDFSAAMLVAFALLIVSAYALSRTPQPTVRTSRSRT